MDNTWIDEASGNPIQEQMIGLDIRGASIRKPTGFYYGTYISIARPMVYWNYDETSETAAFKVRDTYLYFQRYFGV